MKFTLLITGFLLLPNLSFANEAPQLSDEELSDVISAVIELKGNCISKKETECKNSDAVMNMFRYITKGDDSPHKDYMKKYVGLSLEAFSDGYTEAKAEEATSKQQRN